MPISLPTKVKNNPIPLDESERKLTKADFTYHEDDNLFTCPGGQTLDLVRQSKEGAQVYQGDADVCASCPHARCCQSKKGEARTITTDDKEPLRQQMNGKMEQQASKDIYSKRKVIVEPIFGQLKNSGFRGFSVRGKEKVAVEFSLVCATHNIKKIVKAIFYGNRLSKIRSFSYKSNHIGKNQTINPSKGATNR